MTKLALSSSSRRKATALLIWALVVLAASVFPVEPAGAGATEPDATPADGSVDGALDASSNAPSKEVAALWTTAALVEALMEEELSPDIDPTSLFPVDLGDEVAVDVELARLRALLRAVEQDGGAKGAMGGRARPLADAEVRLPPPARWEARLALDRARATFYSLPVERRTTLLEDHTKARNARQPVETEAERKAREAEAERQRALDRARKAATEAERLVSEEHARLLAVAAEQTAFAARLTDADASMAAKREESLRAQRRARDAREGASRSAAADDAYDAVRAVLKATRDSLDEALDRDPAERVPSPGPGSLVALNLETDELRTLRTKLALEAEKLADDARRRHEALLAHLLDETNALNDARLALLPHVTSEKRDAVTGFSAEGTSQAAAEARQLRLVLRYHKHVISTWARGRSAPDAIAQVSAGRTFLAILEALLAVVVFGWWRRRATASIDALIARIREADRLARVTAESPAIGGLKILRAIRSPLEWLVLTIALERILPPAISALLEVEVLGVILLWTFGGRVIVDGLDALAENVTLNRIARSVAGTPGLRRRSLGLVGRVVVVLGVVLVLCAKLVGRGAIYEWVFATSWIFVLPVGLVLVRWWRDEVFARLESLRKPTSFERWVLRNKTGWASFSAAASGGTYLLATGTYRSVRSWVARFEISRRAMAYLFRRKLDKLGQDATEKQLGPLGAARFDALGPESATSIDWVKTPTDDDIDALVTRAAARSGGIVAIFGERGMGKSRTLAQIEARLPGALRLTVPSSRLTDLARTVTTALGNESTTELARALDAARDAEKHVILFDDAHRLVRPTMGGLCELDTLIAAIGSRTEGTLFVLAFDEISWRFLERARTARPVFDDVIELARWNEENIGALLGARSAEAGLEPSFAHLLDALPANADDIDRRDALAARETSYYRLLWDHAAGNPGIALHMWRRAIGETVGGETFVRVFQALDLSDLERLPDATLFVLRAVLQLAPADTAEIGAATLLRPAQVNDALRYAHNRGYVERSPEGGYRVTWTWFRPIVLFLQRRHLLVSP